MNELPHSTPSDAGVLTRATVQAAFDRLRNKRPEPLSPTGLPLAEVANVAAILRGADDKTLKGSVVATPPEVRIAAKALRTAACWLPDEYRDMLREVADDAKARWDEACCPICQEAWCDDGCPLEEVRTELMKRRM